MPQGAFTDKKYHPIVDQINAALGGSAALWNDIAGFVRGNYGVKEEMKFYGKNYGWALRFRKGGRALVSLYPLQGSFKAQIVLNEEAYKKAMKLSLGVRLKKTMRAAHPYPDGRWLFIPVKTRGDVDRVKKLICAKAEK